MKFKNKLVLTTIVAILVTAHILWDYFNGGVPIHHILADGNLPGISNWWGLLIIPTISWISLSLMFKKSELGSNADMSKVVLGFCISLLFGILLSVLWQINLEYILQYLFLAPVVLSLVLKVHKPECFLGFVLGMVYTFGGVLSSVAGLVLLILSFIVYMVFNQGGRYLFSKLNSGKP